MRAKRPRANRIRGETTRIQTKKDIQCFRYAAAVNNGVQSLQAMQEHALLLQHDIMALK